MSALEIMGVVGRWTCLGFDWVVVGRLGFVSGGATSTSGMTDNDNCQVQK